MATETATDLAELGGRDPHAVLAVSRGATPDQVRQAFRRRAMSGGHPDHGGDNATFRALARARDILLDPIRLAAYDDARGVRTSGTTRATSTSFADAANHGPREPSAASTTTRAPGPSATPQNTPRTAPPDPSVPPGTGGWGVATVVLALLGPFTWPVAIVVGHIAVRRANRAGRDSGSAIPVLVFMLYVLSFLVLPRFLIALVPAVVP